jgi:hypothetical protein
VIPDLSFSIARVQRCRSIGNFRNRFSVVAPVCWALVAIDSLTRNVAAMFGGCNARPLLSETPFMKILLIEDEPNWLRPSAMAFVPERLIVDWVPNLLQAPASHAYP